MSRTTIAIIKVAILTAAVAGAAIATPSPAKAGIECSNFRFICWDA